MRTVTSFHASAVPPDQLNAIMADYLALERARVFRSLLVARCGLIALAIAAAGFGLGWLPPFGAAFGVAAFLAVPASAWFVELRRERRLAHRLNGVPGDTVRLVQP